jgi:hypothetical protein
MQHIPKGRELIQTGCPKEATQPRQPRRIGLEAITAAKRLSHRPELDEDEGSAVQTCTLLPEKDWTAICEENRHVDQNHERRAKR